MADSLVGAVDTNDRQYNIPLQASAVDWEWVCTLYKKDGGKVQTRHAVAESARDVAIMLIERKPRSYVGWELHQVMVPIAV